MNGLKFELSFQDEEVSQTIEALNRTGATNIKEEKQRGAVVIGTTIVAYLATAIASVPVVIALSRLWKCGVIVDVRKTKIKTTKDCKLPRGVLIIVSEGGTKVQLDKPTAANLQAAIEKARATAIKER